MYFRGFLNDVVLSYYGASGQNQAVRYVEKTPGGGTSWSSDDYSALFIGMHHPGGGKDCYLPVSHDIYHKTAAKYRLEMLT